MPAFNHSRSDSALEPCPECTRELERLAVTDLGTQNQRERFEAKLLPHDEINKLVRDELFKPLAHETRWNITNGRRGLKGTDVRHHGGRYGCYGTEAIKFETTATDELPGEYWDALKKITRLASLASQHKWLSAGQGFQVLLRAHWATCKICEAEAVHYTALVTVSWAGRMFTREYDLHPPAGKEKSHDAQTT